MIDAVVDTPHDSGLRMPVEAEHVPEAVGEDRAGAILDGEPQVGCFFFAAFEAGVAGAADIDVQCAVRGEGEGAAPMLAAIGQVVDELLKLADGAIVVEVSREDVMDGGEEDAPI